MEYSVDVYFVRFFMSLKQSAAGGEPCKSNSCLGCFVRKWTETGVFRWVRGEQNRKVRVTRTNVFLCCWKNDGKYGGIQGKNGGYMLLFMLIYVYLCLTAPVSTFFVLGTTGVMLLRCLSSGRLYFR